MARKTPIIELDLMYPYGTKKRKFTCKECGVAYSLRNYRILYEAKKISYFHNQEKPNYIVCTMCLYKLAEKLKNELGIRKIILKLNVEDEEVVIKI